MRHLGNLLSDCIDMILSMKTGLNQTSLHSLGIAENVVRLPLVSVDESLQLRISDFVKKLINSDKEGAFFFKAKKYFVVAKLIINHTKLRYDFCRLSLIYEVKKINK
jgi:hypothetical protein